ncbi:MAG: SAM-dependent DNA methyltransferase, partial [Methylococcales bacterium]|nr:SAM-dependent DNA methyltransferase [Methylococcales bacterium]
MNTESSKSLMLALDALRGNFRTTEYPLILGGLIYLRWAETQDENPGNDSHYKPILPASLHWSSWHKMPSAELAIFLRSQLLPALINLEDAAEGTIPFHLRMFGKSLDDFLQLSEESLSGIIQWLSEQPFDSATDRRKLLSVFDDLLLSSYSHHGLEAATPISLSKLVVSLANPEPEDKIYDPCFGFAHFLTSACNINKGFSCDLNLTGIERNFQTYLIGLVRLILAGAGKAQLQLGDSIGSSFEDSPAGSEFDFVLAHPPWGMKINPAFNQGYPVQTEAWSNQLLQKSLKQLKPGGKAIFV